MEIAVYRNFLFDTRCGAKDFSGKLKAPETGALFYNSLMVVVNDRFSLCPGCKTRTPSLFSIAWSR